MVAAETPTDVGEVVNRWWSRTGPVSEERSARMNDAGGVYSIHDVMKIIILSLICSTVIGIIVAAFLRFVKVLQ